MAKDSHVLFGVILLHFGATIVSASKGSSPLFPTDEENLNEWIQWGVGISGPKGNAMGSLVQWNTNSSVKDGYLLLYGGCYEYDDSTIDSKVFRSNGQNPTATPVSDKLWATKGTTGDWGIFALLEGGPGPRMLHTGEVIGQGESQRMVVFGGLTEFWAGDPLANTYILTLGMTTADLAWSTLESGAVEPSPRYGHFTLVARTHMYMFGGCGDDEDLDSTWQFNTSTKGACLLNDTWLFNSTTSTWGELDLIPPDESCGPMGRAMGGSTISRSASGGTWYMMGGFNLGSVATVWSLDVSLIHELGLVGSAGKVGWKCAHYGGVAAYWPTVVGGQLLPQSQTRTTESVYSIVVKSLAFCGFYVASYGPSSVQGQCWIIPINFDNTTATTNANANVNTSTTPTTPTTLSPPIIDIGAYGDSASSLLPCGAANGYYDFAQNVYNLYVFGGIRGPYGFSKVMRLVHSQQSNADPSPFVAIVELADSGMPDAPPTAGGAVRVDCQNNSESIVMTTSINGKLDLWMLVPAPYSGELLRNKDLEWTLPTILFLPDSAPSSAYDTLNVLQSIKNKPCTLAAVSSTAVYTITITSRCVRGIVTQDCSQFFPVAKFKVHQTFSTVYGAAWSNIVTGFDDTLMIYWLVPQVGAIDEVITATVTYISLDMGCKYTVTGVNVAFEFDQGSSVFTNAKGEQILFVLNKGEIIKGQMTSRCNWHWETYSDKAPRFSQRVLPSYTTFGNSLYMFGGIGSMAIDAAAMWRVLSNESALKRIAFSRQFIQGGHDMIRAFFDADTETITWTNITVSIGPTVKFFTDAILEGVLIASGSGNNVELVSFGGWSNNQFFQVDSLNPVTTIVVSCGPGENSSQFSKTMCSKCARGTWSNLYGQKTCNACPDGTTTTEVGAVTIGNCSVCLQGYCNTGACAVPGYGLSADCTCTSGYYGDQCQNQIPSTTGPVIGGIVFILILAAVGYWGYRKYTRPVKTFHVFISYRVACEASLARKICRELVGRELDDNVKLVCYLDQKNIESGTDWEVSFLNGLERSCLFVPLISAAATKPIEKVSVFDDKADNLLLEYETALNNNTNKKIGIYPLLVGEIDNDGAYTPFGPSNFDVERFPNGQSKTCKKIAVRETMRALFKIQGDFVRPDGLTEAQSLNLVSYLKDHVWRGKSVDCLNLHRYWVSDEESNEKSLSKFKRVGTMVNPYRKNTSVKSVKSKTPPWEIELGNTESLNRNLLHPDDVV